MKKKDPCLGVALEDTLLDPNAVPVQERVIVVPESEYKKLIKDQIVLNFAKDFVYNNVHVFKEDLLRIFGPKETENDVR